MLVIAESVPIALHNRCTIRRVLRSGRAFSFVAIRSSRCQKTQSIHCHRDLRVVSHAARLCSSQSACRKPASLAVAHPAGEVGSELRIAVAAHGWWQRSRTAQRRPSLLTNKGGHPSEFKNLLNGAMELELKGVAISPVGLTCTHAGTNGRVSFC